MFNVFVTIFVLVLWPISIVLTFVIFKQLLAVREKLQDLESTVRKIEGNLCLGVDISDLPNEFKERIKKVAVNSGLENAVIVIKEDLGVEQSKATELVEAITNE